MRRFIRLLSLLVVSLLATTGIALAQGASQSAPGLEKALAAQERHNDALFKNPRVVATGVGLNPAGKAVIKVYIEKGKKQDVPDSLDGVPVETIASDRVYAQRGACDNPNANPNACRPDQPKAPPGSGVATGRYDRPVPIGVSAGHTNITAGTIGCRVQAGCHQYALSNNHVFADEGSAAIGDDIIQPGAFDGGAAPADVVGTLYDFEPIVFSTSANNIMDAALIEVNAAMVGTATPEEGYGLPRTVPVDAYPNMDVMKYGRTTGLTTARVDAINATVNVGYDAGTARFVNQIIIRPGTFSAGGDSGSLIVVNGGPDDRRPVGLLFAGSNSITIANPIGPVLARFGAKIEGE